MTRREALLVGDAAPLMAHLRQALAAHAHTGPLPRYMAALQCAILSYSQGDTLQDVQASVQQAIAHLAPSPHDATEPFDLRQPEQYHLALWGLSLAMLMGLPVDGFLHRAAGQDALMDRLLALAAPAQAAAPAEALLHPEPGRLLLQALDQAPELAAASLREYLRRWYTDGQADTPWHDLHVRQEPGFFGYWAFEVAAAVRASGIPDRDFADNLFYPRDLVQQRLFRTWLDDQQGEADRGIRDVQKAQQNIAEMRGLLQEFFHEGSGQAGQQIAEKADETMKLLGSLLGPEMAKLQKDPSRLKEALLQLMRAVLKAGQEAASAPATSKAGDTQKLRAAFADLEKKLSAANPGYRKLEDSLRKDLAQQPAAKGAPAAAHQRIHHVQAALSEMLAQDSLSLEDLLSGLERIADQHAEKLGIQRPKPHDAYGEVSAKLRQQLNEDSKGSSLADFDWSSLWRKKE